MPSTFSDLQETHALIGRIIKPQGLHGEVKIHCYSGQPENIKNYQRLVLAQKTTGRTIELCIQRCRVQKTAAIVLFESITDRNTAELYTGFDVFVARADLPEPASGEFYWLDVQGKKACTTDGREIGEISHFFSNGAHDIMVITDGQIEYLVPVVSGIVQSITRECVFIEAPPGLLEMNNSSDE